MTVYINIRTKMKHNPKFQTTLLKNDPRLQFHLQFNHNYGHFYINLTQQKMQLQPQKMFNGE